MNSFFRNRFFLKNICIFRWFSTICEGLWRKLVKIDPFLKNMMVFCIKNICIGSKTSYIRLILHVESISGTFSTIRGRNLDFSITLWFTYAPKMIPCFRKFSPKNSMKIPKRWDFLPKISQTDLPVSTTYSETYSIMLRSIRVLTQIFCRGVDVMKLFKIDLFLQKNMFFSSKTLLYAAICRS